MNAANAIQLVTEDLKVILTISGREPRDRGDPVWLYANLAVTTRQTGGDLRLEGPVGLMAEDLNALEKTLRRIVRPPIGSAGRLDEWETHDEDLKLDFRTSAADVIVTGSVRTGVGSILVEADLGPTRIGRPELLRFWEDVHRECRSWSGDAEAGP